MRRIGFLVNPIAGMGGRVGLKGTDDRVEEARERGAEPRAPGRAVDALRALTERASELALVTWGDPMGESVAREAGFDPVVVGAPDGEETSAEDTQIAVKTFVDRDVESILFVGGDGTAVDVAEALDAVDADVPILGVPAGVKIYSAVFAVTPEEAGRIVADYDRVEEREVSDIDEEAYRDGEVRSALRAVVRVPVAAGLQSGKQLSGGTVEDLAEAYADDIDPETTYVLGPGSTVGAIKEALGFEGSPLGVDVWRNGEVLVRDASEAEILAALSESNVIVVSPIGGQGFIFGRGNQQLSPAVIRRSTVDVVASRHKLDRLGVLRVDLDDPDVVSELTGWIRVRIGRFEHRMMQVV